MSKNGRYKRKNIAKAEMLNQYGDWDCCIHGKSYWSEILLIIRKDDYELIKNN